MYVASFETNGLGIFLILKTYTGLLIISHYSHNKQTLFLPTILIRGRIMCHNILGVFYWVSGRKQKI
jgi:hypothetical protein